MNPWEPIHVRVDDTSQWYQTQVERGDYLRDTEEDAEMSHREHGLVAEAIVKGVFPGFEWWDTESFDLFRGNTRYDIISRNINRGEPRQNYLHHLPPKKEERAKPSTNYYAVVRKHPDYWLIGHINSVRGSMMWCSEWIHFKHRSQYLHVINPTPTVAFRRIWHHVAQPSSPHALGRFA